jgi:acetylornithine deacetylase/succinyl-diaminopimelate desuccinylase-like protein
VAGSGSTDANIPHSLGIPAITMAVWSGSGAHTREEYVVKNSLVPGFEIGIRTALALA